MITTEHTAECETCGRIVRATIPPAQADTKRWVRCATCEQILAVDPSSLGDGWEDHDE